MSLNKQQELEYLQLKKKKAEAMARVSTASPPKPTLGQQAVSIAQSATRQALLGPATATKKFFQTDPATMQRTAGPALPMLGGAVGGPVGAAGGELLRQATGTALAPETVPKTPLGRFGSVMGQGIMAEPKILGAIPGASKVGEMAKSGFNKLGRGIGKVFSSVSGVEPQVYKEAFKKGLRTYLAPSMGQAQEDFGKALTEAGVGPPSVESRYDPQLTVARKIARDVMKKLQSGADLTAEEALRGRQSVQRIINATSYKDKAILGQLYKDSRLLDNELSSKSGELANASRGYRSAIVKKQLTQPIRITKTGKPSMFVGILSALESIGLHSLKPFAYALATGPAVTGVATTTAGTIYKILDRAMEIPAIRQGLLAEISQKFSSQPEEQQPDKQPMLLGQGR